MNSLTRILLLALLVPGALLSQSRLYWQTTRFGSSSGECRLESNKIRMTVHPFHVDVEEEAVIATYTNYGSVYGDPSTLEIVGEFELSKGSAVRSLLLWNGKTILKAKLRDRKEADSVYEQVVGRGRIVHTWNDVRLNGNTLKLALPPRAQGCMILRVNAGGAVVQKKITVAR